MQPKHLWIRIQAQTDHALRCGALQPIPTEAEFVEQDGISFLVRIVSNLNRKDEAKKQQEQKKASLGKQFNPFLPYDKDLFIADLSETHLCILNKYNAVDYHLLIVTRAFEEQEDWLNWGDFGAMWSVLAELEGLAFYNGGKTAGSSQPHKHLQVVPLPLTPEVNSIPIASALATAQFQGTVGTVPGFPFRHAIAKLDPSWTASPPQAATATLECYDTLIRAVGLSERRSRSQQQTGPYNLLATKEWMMLVPRSQESFQSIAVNALGFAGALLVRNQEQMQILKQCGPMTLLKNVAQ